MIAVSISPAAYSVRQACRRTFPLVVLGTVPGGTSTTVAAPIW